MLITRSKADESMSGAFEVEIDELSQNFAQAIAFLKRRQDSLDQEVQSVHSQIQTLHLALVNVQKENNDKSKRIREISAAIAGVTIS